MMVVGRQEFSFGEGAIAQVVWGVSSPSAVQGRSPGKGSRPDEVPQKLKQFANIVYIFYCRNYQNVKISHNSPPDF